MPKHYLITGGAGFIGRYLSHGLIAQGHDVTILDDLSTGRRDLLNINARFAQGDVRDSSLLGHLVKQVHGIFHLAACVSVQACIQSWDAAHSVNLGGTISVLKEAQCYGNLPVVYASSAAVYGRASRDICKESCRPLPMSPYGADKLACEHQAMAFHEVHGLGSVGLRFFNVYGSGQDFASPYAGVIARFLRNRHTEIAHSVYGDGEQSRDFVHVNDVVTALIAAMAHAASDAAPADVFNVCTGTETSLLRLIGALDRISGRKPALVHHLQRRDGDITRSAGCPAEAGRVLGFRAAIDLDTGLAELWNLRDRQLPEAASVNGSQG